MVVGGGGGPLLLLRGGGGSDTGNILSVEGWGGRGAPCGRG